MTRMSWGEFNDQFRETPWERQERQRKARKNKSMTEDVSAQPAQQPSDLVKRLRASYFAEAEWKPLLVEAADRIEALEADNAKMAREVAARHKEECTCTQLASNSFDEPPEYETDPACPIHGRALEAAAAQPSREAALVKAASKVASYEITDDSSAEFEADMEELNNALAPYNIDTPAKDERRDIKRPDWEYIYRTVSHEADRDDELVTVTRETARLASNALRKMNGEDYYHNNGAAESELMDVLVAKDERREEAK